MSSSLPFCFLLLFHHPMALVASSKTSLCNSASHSFLHQTRAHVRLSLKERPYHPLRVVVIATFAFINSNVNKFAENSVLICGICVAREDRVDSRLWNSQRDLCTNPQFLFLSQSSSRVCYCRLTDSDRPLSTYAESPKLTTAFLSNATVIFCLLPSDYDAFFWLAFRIQQITPVFAFESALHPMSLTRVGGFSFPQPDGFQISDGESEKQ